MKKADFVFRVLPFVLAVILVAVALVVPGMMRASWASEESEAQASVDAARSTAKETEQEFAQAQQASVKDATGFDSARAHDDANRIEDFLRVACTWQDWDSYDAARTKAIEEFGCDENCQFFTTYMQAMPRDAVNGKGETLERGNIIDRRGLKLELQSTHVYYVSSDDERDTYQYLVEFEAGSTSEGYTVGHSYFMRCFVDSDGNILDAYAESVS